MSLLHIQPAWSWDSTFSPWPWGLPPSVCQTSPCRWQWHHTHHPLWHFWQHKNTQQTDSFRLLTFTGWCHEWTPCTTLGIARSFLPMRSSLDLLPRWSLLQWEGCVGEECSPLRSLLRCRETWTISFLCIRWIIHYWPIRCKLDIYDKRFVFCGRQPIFV